MNSRFDYTILDAISNAMKTVKASPLVLGATSVGSGGPIGGFVGYLTPRRVAYDTEELETMDTPISGLSIVDNLNHIRYRLGSIESGYATYFVDLDDVPNTYSGSVGKALVVNSAESGLEFSDVSGSITVLSDGVTVLSGVTGLGFNGATVSVSGSIAVIAFSGSLPAFDSFRVPVTDESGEIFTHDGIQYDYTKKALFVGGSPEVAVSDNSINQISDGVSAAHFLYTWGAGLASYVTGFLARGTKSSPAAVLMNDIMLKIRGRAYDGSYSVTTSAEIDLAADEDHAPGSHGSRVDIYTTPNGSSTMVKAVSVTSNGDLDIQAGKTYNVDGIPHTHDIDYDQLHAEIG